MALTKIKTGSVSDDSITSSKLAAALDVETSLSIGGASNGVAISNGAIALKNSGTASKIDFYCESSNAHFTRLQSAPHSAYSGNITLTLPASDGNANQFLKTNGAGVMSWGSAGVDSAYISTTPTGTSPADNQITVTNHSVFTSPTYKVFDGSTELNATTSGALISISDTVVGSTGVTVVVSEAGTGKLFSAPSAAITVTLAITAFRYWRIGTFQIASTNPYLTRFHLHPAANLGGAKQGAASGYTQNIATPYGQGAQATFNNTTTDGWWSLALAGANTYNSWITVDLGSPKDIKSLLIGWYVGGNYYAQYAVVDKSNDNSNWTQVLWISNMTAQSQNTYNI